MKIGILGTGDVGKAPGSGLVRLGHRVKLGSRDPKSKKVKSWMAASSGTFAEAAAYGDMVILATLWSGTENALQLAGQENLA